MDFVSSEKKESSEAIESDAILSGMRFCLEQKILLSGQRDVMALELYSGPNKALWYMAFAAESILVGISNLSSTI